MCQYLGEGCVQGEGFLLSQPWQFASWDANRATLASDMKIICLLVLLSDGNTLKESWFLHGVLLISACRTRCSSV